MFFNHTYTHIHTHTHSHTHKYLKKPKEENVSRRVRSVISNDVEKSNKVIKN